MGVFNKCYIIPKDSVFVFSNDGSETVPEKLNSVTFQTNPTNYTSPCKQKQLQIILFMIFLIF